MKQLLIIFSFFALLLTGFNVMAQGEENLSKDDASITLINDTEQATQKVVVRYVKMIINNIKKNEYVTGETIRIGLLVKREHPNSFFNICNEAFREQTSDFTDQVGKPRSIIVEFVSDINLLERYDFAFVDASYPLPGGASQALKDAQDKNTVLITYNAARGEDFMINLYKNEKNGRMQYELNIPNLAGDYEVNEELINAAYKVAR